ncbi:hypothetical protein GYMLUDRAFT_41619 [Collybiopsis luxurians FD-317 M1]|uniref:ubiquitinyl hydrolase 1 n=1 Tax=Collybiopsis luxurians FD-317 M1 TaxID=944289 RepID=A0A0D0D0X1_9AGAR|nr:hypothetical protein GYMLUDRAFT_41619 [Collybiopsis luxurians FD-317 M1]
MVEEVVEEDPEGGEEEDGWMEVGKRNRSVVTRTIKSTESPISRIFGGKFRTSLRVPGAKESAIVEDWRSLRLDIQPDTIHTIQDALSHISAPQTINLSSSSSASNNAASSSSASSSSAAAATVPREGSQQLLIEALPPVLVIHLKRFEYNKDVGGVVKVGKEVRFGPELVVGTDVLSVKGRSMAGAGGGGTKGVKYKLFGVIYHHGISASGGHYTLDVLHPERYPPSTPTNGAKSTLGQNPREGWIRIDDELVSDVRPEDVFGFGGGAGEQGGFFEDGATGNMRCAYLLFYRRVR